MANNRRAEELYAKSQAERRTVGHAYLTAFAHWFRESPDMPRLKRSLVNVQAKSGYPDSPRIRVADDICEAVGWMVLRLPADEAEVVWAHYLRIRWRRVSNTEWTEHLRGWRAEDLAKLLKVSRTTYFDRLASARSRIESWAERDALLPPPA